MVNNLPGVGKTLTADLVARSLLYGDTDSEGRLCGKLVFQMGAYTAADNAAIERNSKDINNRVAQQLYHCPRSVLILDEIQSVPEPLLDSVLNLFDSPDGTLAHLPSLAAWVLPEPLAATVASIGGMVNVSQCVVIVTSDLGSARLSSSMGREEAKRSAAPRSAVPGPHSFV
jgi:DNA polymerase III delta prime subunit